MLKLAINGFGRIGRLSFRVAFEKEDIEIVAINDLTEIEIAAHLLKYDSSYGRYGKNVEVDAENKELIVDGTRIKYFSETDPQNLPWRELEVDVVLECTGVFDTREKMEKHLAAGAGKVILSAPAKDDMPVYLLGVNEKDYNGEKIISNGSCTTNCLAPIVKILDDNFGLERGFMTTTHSYTNDQRLQDLPHKDLRRARAAAQNIIPTTTGAAKTVAKALSHLEGKLNGISLRVPTPTVSITDFVCLLKKSVSVEEINESLRQAAQMELKNILAVTEEPLVSMDFKGDSHSVIADLSLTMADENLVKVIGWYDNEWGYANRLVEMSVFINNWTEK